MSAAAKTAHVYRPRRAKDSPLRKILERHFDEFLDIYDERYARRYGPLRKVVPRTVERFLRCGIPEWGFARIRCPQCGLERILPFSCKTKGVCPSCHAKRQAEFGEFLARQILEPVPHRQVVLSIPRRLRPFFRRDRRRLTKLARAAFETIKELLQEAVGDREGVPGVVAAIHTFGNLLDAHQHIHMVVSWGLFKRDGSFIQVTGAPKPEVMEKLFRHKVLRMLLDEDAIDESVVRNMLSWKHTGFGAHAGDPVGGWETRRIENLARYFVRPPVVLKRILADGSEGDGKIVYKADAVHPRHGANFRIFDPLDFIAEVTSHIPNPHEKSVIYYA